MLEREGIEAFITAIKLQDALLKKALSEDTQLIVTEDKLNMRKVNNMFLISKDEYNQFVKCNLLLSAIKKNFKLSYDKDELIIDYDIIDAFKVIFPEIYTSELKRLIKDAGGDN